MANISFTTKICHRFFKNPNNLYLKVLHFMENPEAAVQRCSEEKVLCKYAANLQENTYAKV